MQNSDKETIISWTSGINMALGIWLFLSAWMVPALMTASRANDLFFGVVIFVLSVIRNSVRSRTGLASWLSAGAGIWVIVAPFAMGYAVTGQRLNSVIVGIVVAVLAAVNGGAGATRRPAAPA